MRVALLFVLLAALLPTAAAAQSPPARLEARGPDLYYGPQRIILKGTNFDNINALGAGIGSNNVNDVTFGDAHYAELARQGGNHVRLGLSYSWYANQRAAFFAKMDEQVALARKYGIFLVFNLFTTPGNCYEGYSNSCGFWGSAAEQNQLIAFWVEMALRYDGEPAVAGYDLLNEPTPPSDCKAWFSIAAKTITEIRKVSQKLVFVNTCSDPGNDLKFNGPPRGASIVYEVHDYAPMDMSHDMFSPGSVYPGTASEWFGSCYVDKNVFATGQGCALMNIRETYGLNWAAQQGVPIYIGEWGAASVLRGYEQYHKDKAELYRDWGVHHAHYTWKHQTIKTGGFYQWGMYSTNASQTDDPAKLNAVKIAWEGAIRPNFGQVPPPPPPADVTATVPPTATRLPTDTPGPTLAPPTALTTRTPNATQVGRTATAAARTATAQAVTPSATREPTATAAPPTTTPQPATGALGVTLAADATLVTVPVAGGVLISTWPEMPAGAALPAGCSGQGMSVWCWGAQPGIVRLPWAAERVVVRQGASVATAVR